MLIFIIVAFIEVIVNMHCKLFLHYIYFSYSEFGFKPLRLSELKI